MRYPLLGFPLSDDPSRCSCRTIRGCCPYRSSHAECRFGRSESIGNGFGQPSGVVAVAGGVTGGVGDIDGDLVEVV